MKVFCLISDHRAFLSKSPAMHTRALKSLGLSGLYAPFQVEPERLEDAVRGIRALNIAGANVTVPYKEAVMSFLDGLSETASAIGAVNTIVREEERLIGHNTDAGGFMDALEAEGYAIRGRGVWVVGTGGAARAVLFALGTAGADPIVVSGRDREKTAGLAKRFKAHPLPLDVLCGSRIDPHVVVNTSSVSSPSEAPELGGILKELRLDSCELVMDINYGRSENMWWDLARANQSRFMDGLSMLAHQARRSFALWTGMDPGAAVFLDSLRGRP